MHYAFNVKQTELFPVTEEELNVELCDSPARQGDDVCEYL